MSEPIPITEPIGIRKDGEPFGTQQITEPVKIRRITEPFGPRQIVGSPRARRTTVNDTVVHVGHPIPRRREELNGRSQNSDDLQLVRLSLSEDNDVTSCFEDMSWQKVGAHMDLVRFHCQRLYCKDGNGGDLGLFYNNGNFYAMGAWCGHMGGPLFEGDIEDLHGRAHVMCPWHSYMFDLESGKNNLGMKQTVHPVRVEDGFVYILHKSELSTKPFTDNQ